MKKLFTMMYVPVLALILLACGDDSEDPIPAGNPLPPISSDEYTTAEALLASQGFRGSVLIQKNGQDVIRKGYGMADAAAGIPNDVSKVYRIGSMTKAFTAAGIVYLKRDGLIESFDQPLSDFEEDFPDGENITLRHLLTHESGLQDYVGPIEAAASDLNTFFTPEDILDIVIESIEDEGTLYEPGDRFYYSNTNYLILGLLIEELTDMSYHDYLQLKVFTPLGMSHTRHGEDNIIGDEYAKGYENGTEVAPYQMQIAFSAGDLESTIGDIEIWANALMGDFYTAEEKAQVFAAPYGQDDINTIGFGWFTITIDGKLMHHHGGDIDGFTSFLGILPESQSVIILLSNEQDKGAERNLIVETLQQHEF